MKAALVALLVLAQDARETERILRHSPLGKPPPDPTNALADSPAAARLGQRLFFDARLSGDGMSSCASCHDPRLGFADGQPLPEKGARHVPALVNLAWQRWFFWDGRVDSLWAQARQPIESPDELGGSREALARLLALDPTLAREYEALLGARAPDHEPVRVLANAGKALAAYLRRLESRDSAFDRYAAALAKGDEEAMAAYPASARRGLSIFVGRGNCSLCHAGPNFSDAEFHDTGLAPLGGGKLFDAGRMAGVEKLLADPFNAAGAFSDERDGERARELATLARGSGLWGQFKTPTLRSVALSPPYMHQGQLATLRDVVRFYSTLEGGVPAGHHREQVLKPLELTEPEIDDLVAFLESLTGAPLPEELLRPVK